VTRPPFSNEAGRRGFRQAGHGRTVHAAQQVDGTHEWRCSRHALEDECVEERGCPASDASIVLAQHLIGVKFLRTRQRFSLGYRRAEAVPRDDPGDRIKCILFAVARRNKGGADAGIKTDFLVDGATGGLERAGVLPFGFAEHRPDQPVEQVDCLVGQAGGEVERDRDQSSVSARAFVSGQMLHRGAAGFTGKLGQAYLVDAVGTSGVDAERTHVNQSLDQTQHRKRLRCLRHLAEPRQPALSALSAVLCERIQAMALIGRQSLGQPTLHLSSCLVADADAETFKCARQRHDDPPLPAFLHHQPSEVSEPIVLDRMRQQPAGQFVRRARTEGIQSQSILQFGGMALSIALSDDVGVKRGRKNINLLCDK